MQYIIYGVIGTKTCPRPQSSLFSTLLAFASGFTGLRRRRGEEGQAATTSAARCLQESWTRGGGGGKFNISAFKGGGLLKKTGGKNLLAVNYSAIKNILDLICNHCTPLCLCINFCYIKFVEAFPSLSSYFSLLVCAKRRTKIYLRTLWYIG